MSYQTEFPDFILDVAIPADWIDISWHNDVCPSWETPRGLRVFVDYADPEKREVPQYARFAVLQDDPDYRDDGNSILESDDWSQVLQFVDDRPLQDAQERDAFGGRD